MTTTIRQAKQNFVDESSSFETTSPMPENIDWIGNTENYTSIDEAVMDILNLTVSP